MAEKKKVAVVVDASATASAPVQQQGSKPAFDFSSFQGEYYPDGGSAGSAAQQPPARSDPAGVYVSTYQSRKTSIVAGVSSDELVVMHRKSLCDIATKGGTAAADISELHGVTLSRRHTLSAEEYDANVAQDKFRELETYDFDKVTGTAPAAATATATAAH